MGIFGKNRRSRPIENGDALPVETRVCIINAVDLIRKTREAMREEGGGLDMTCRFQLNSDMSLVEKAIAKADSPRSGEKEFHELDTAVQRLRTSAENILDIG